MKRFFVLFLFSILQLSAEQETGAAAAEAADASNSNWQNWVFAGSALVTATVGVIIIAVSSGTTSH